VRGKGLLGSSSFGEKILNFRDTEAALSLPKPRWNGLLSTAIAFIVVKGEEISFHGIKRGGALDGLFEHLPDLTEKILAKCPEAEVKGNGM